MQYKVKLKAGGNTPGLDTLTKAEIIKLLEEKKIKFNPRAKKDDLIALLGGD